MCDDRQGTIASGAIEPFMGSGSLVLCVVDGGVDVVVAAVDPTDLVVPRRVGDLLPFGMLVTMLRLVLARCGLKTLYDNLTKVEERHSLLLL